jgi:hypothetical protein
MNELIEYLKLHIISLEQDSEELEKEMGFYDDLDCDEFKDLEIEDISINGQLIATHHILSVAQGILKD